MKPMVPRQSPCTRWLAGTLAAALVCAATPPPAFALRAAGLEENADRERVAQLLGQGGVPTPIARVAGQDVSAQVRRLLRYKVYEPSELTDRLDDLRAVMTTGLSTFETFLPSRQLAVYRLAGLLGLANRLESRGVDPNRLSYDSYRIITHSEDVHSLPTRGFEMPVGQTWSTLRTEHYRRILEIPEAVFPSEGVSVLSAFGEDGGPLLQLAPLMRNSRLVLLDANSANVRRAMDRFDAQRDGNTYEIRLSDVRAGFGGIPYPNDAFDVVLMLGHPEHGMSRDDLLRALTEILRVLKLSGGRLFLETNHADRYGWALQQLVQRHRAWSVAMYPLADAIFLVVKQPAAGMEEVREFGSVEEFVAALEGQGITLRPAQRADLERKAFGAGRVLDLPGVSGIATKKPLSIVVDDALRDDPLIGRTVRRWFDQAYAVDSRAFVHLVPRSWLVPEELAVGIALKGQTSPIPGIPNIVIETYDQLEAMNVLNVYAVARHELNDQSLPPVVAVFNYKDADGNSRTAIFL